MRRSNSNSGWTIPKLRSQPPRFQFSLKALLIVLVVAGPLIAFFAEPAQVLVRGLTYFRLPTLPLADLISLLKFVTVAAFAFGLVPFVLSKVHPLVALIAAFLFAGLAIYLWHLALNDVSYSQVPGAGKKMRDRTLIELELATAATVVLVGTIVGGMISFFTRDPA